MARIVDYLAVPDLIRFARVSRRMQEMVYDDTRWVQRLRRMDCWNEVEARKRAESLRRVAHNVTTPTAKRKSTNPSFAVNGLDRPPPSPKLVDTLQATVNSTLQTVRKTPLENVPGASAVYVGGVKRGTLSLAASSTLRKQVLLLPRLAAMAEQWIGSGEGGREGR